MKHNKNYQRWRRQGKSSWWNDDVEARGTHILATLKDEGHFPEPLSPVLSAETFVKGKPARKHQVLGRVPGTDSIYSSLQWGQTCTTCFTCAFSGSSQEQSLRPFLKPSNIPGLWSQYVAEPIFEPKYSCPQILILRFCLWGFNQWVDGKYLEKWKLPESPKKQNWNLPHTGHYLHGIYTVVIAIYITHCIR